jgi:hypothetical protein
MGGEIVLAEDEVRALYAILEARGDRNDAVLSGLLRRIEERLFGSLTIEEIEALRSEPEGDLQ